MTLHIVPGEKFRLQKYKVISIVSRTPYQRAKTFHYLPIRRAFRHRNYRSLPFNWSIANSFDSFSSPFSCDSWLHSINNASLEIKTNEQIKFGNFCLAGLRRHLLSTDSASDILQSPAGSTQTDNIILHQRSFVQFLSIVIDGSLRRIDLKF